MNFYEPQGLRAKAAEHWAGAQSEQAAGRFSTAMALAYYACFQTVLAWHVEHSGEPDRGQGYSHGVVYLTASALLAQRKREDLVPGLVKLYNARLRAQYTSSRDSAEVCEDIMRIAKEVLETLQGGSR
jgi:hypothetical protein